MKFKNFSIFSFKMKINKTRKCGTFYQLRGAKRS